MSSPDVRGLGRVTDSVATHEGEGFLVHRPFVMNTRAEVLQAFEDYRSGRRRAIDS